MVDFLTKPASKPRFVSYPMALPHRSFEPPPTLPEYTGIPPDDDDERYIGSMIEYLDTIVGRLIVDSTDFYPTLAKWFGPRTTLRHSFDGISIAEALANETTSTRESAFFWYDPRPGWDKEAFSRNVFAVNRKGKFFREDCSYYRLTAQPLEETEIAPKDRLESDVANAKHLQQQIKMYMAGTPEHKLVDAFGDAITN